MCMAHALHLLRTEIHVSLVILTEEGTEKTGR